MVDGVRGERGNTCGAKAGEVMHVKKKSRKELTTRKEACVRLHARSNV
jgi:ethanolamine utilization protein EutQ (cupin superfamily)